MPNRFCDLIPGARIQDDFHKITEGFDDVEAEVDQLQDTKVPKGPTWAELEGE